MNATCRLCEQHSAITETVMTDVGQVKVKVCMVCDRAKCAGCGKPLPGNAGKCACGRKVMPLRD